MTLSHAIAVKSQVPTAFHVDDNISVTTGGAHRDVHFDINSNGQMSEKEKEKFKVWFHEKIKNEGYGPAKTHISYDECLEVREPTFSFINDTFILVECVKITNDYGGNGYFDEHRKIKSMIYRVDSFPPINLYTFDKSTSTFYNGWIGVDVKYIKPSIGLIDNIEIKLDKRHEYEIIEQNSLLVPCSSTIRNNVLSHLRQIFGNDVSSVLCDYVLVPLPLIISTPKDVC